MTPRSFVGPRRVSQVAVLAAVVVVFAACGSGARPALTEAESMSDIAAVDGSIITYDFANDGDLGIGSTAEWTQVFGDWQIQNGVVVTTGGSETNAKGTVALATVPVGSADGFYQVTLATSGNQAGLVFRFSNPDNYWYVAAAPDFASWGLVKVVDGDRVSVGDIGLAPVGDSTSVGVLLNGPDITVMLNGKTFDAISDGTHVDAGSAGLFVGGNVAESTATFDNFHVLAVRQGAGQP